MAIRLVGLADSGGTIGHKHVKKVPRRSTLAQVKERKQKAKQLEEEKRLDELKRAAREQNVIRKNAHQRTHVDRHVSGVSDTAWVWLVSGGMACEWWYGL